MNGISSTRTGTKRLRSAVSSSDAGESHATSSSPLVPTSSIATPSNGNVASSGAGAATGTASANKRSRRSSSTAGSTGINGGNGN